MGTGNGRPRPRSIHPALYQGRGVPQKELRNHARRPLRSPSGRTTTTTTRRVTHNPSAQSDPRRLPYCWTHGITQHPGTACQWPAEGHIPEATLTNRHGGSQRLVLGIDREKPNWDSTTAQTETPVETEEETAGTATSKDEQKATQEEAAKEAAESEGHLASTALTIGPHTTSVR